MTLVTSVRAYFRVRPESFADAVRLYSAYAPSALLREAAPSRFGSVGSLVPGSRNLHVRIDGIKFEVRPGTNDLDLISPKHEPLTTRWFQPDAGQVVVDVGAHLGRYALRAAAIGARVVAIEPDPSNFDLLERNVRMNGYSGVELIPQAMTANPGPRMLSVAPRWNTGMSSVEPGRDSATIDPAAGEVRVVGETLDNVVRMRGIHNIDWLKIDVEGHEVPVLEGAHLTLGMTSHLILEVTRDTAGACTGILDDHGFELVSIEAGFPASNWMLVKHPTQRAEAP